MKRRQVLQRLLQASSGLIGAYLMASCDRASKSPFLPNLLTPAEPLPAHLVTPLSEFYVQSYGLPVSVVADQWQLEITGAIATPLKLSYQDILAAAQDDFYLTMECIGNPAGGNQIGNALWTGTPLLPFLQKAGVKPEAVEFMLHGADFYETTLPVNDVMRPNVYLVHQMNRAPLTKEHGYPVRIIIPGYYGQKQPKWLVKIEAIAQSKQGYWERQGWSNIAKIATHALIRQVQDTRVWNRQNEVAIPRQGEQGWSHGVWIAGVAIDQSSPIQRILISTDDGKTWQPAEQNHPTLPHEWTLWRYPWRPAQPGQHTLLARAESQRETQALEDKDSMDGSSGILKIQVKLEA